MLLLLCPLLLCQSCWLEAARGLEEAVKCESITEASLGEEANFSCNFLLPTDVLQVTWQKINGSSFQNIATYSQAHGLRLIGSFQRKARFIRAALNTSAIALQNLTFEDVSCYRCIFNAFPHGSFSSKDICLNIQISELTEEFEYHLATKGFLTAVSSATGKSPPSVTWLVDGGLDESPKIHHIQNPNGTLTVANKCTFYARNHRIAGVGRDLQRSSSQSPSQSRLLTSGCTESRNTDNPEDKMLDLLSPNTRGIEKRIGLVVVFIGSVLAVLILLIMGLINRRRRKLQKQRARSTPKKEKGLQQDVTEQSESLNMLKD